MKKFLLFFILLLMFSCSDNDKRPNILFIMSDDHAYQAISAYDDKLIQTPNIDRIADEGILFTNACVTNSICAAGALSPCLKPLFITLKYPPGRFLYLGPSSSKSFATASFDCSLE